MPANLPPQYFEAERVYRLAKTAPEKIAALEDMLAIMPKHKGTDHLRAELRTRIAKLSQGMGKKSAVHRTSMVVEKEGAGQVVVVGLPNVGKSQLVASVTNASPATGDYAFTTHTAIPGMMEFENIKIQLIDTPPLAPQSIEFWMPHLLRRADALLIVLDLGNNPLVQMDDVVDQLTSMRISIGVKEAEESVFLSKQRTLLVGNKLDMDNARGNLTILQNKYGEQLTVVGISAQTGMGLEELKRQTYILLNIIRVYTKTPGQKPDSDDPIILERGSTVENAAEEVHKDFKARLKYARVWGSGKHDGIRVRREHILQDGDIIELHM